MPHRSAASLVVAGALALGSAADAGDLDPAPGPVAPTMKTLERVEPRRPITSVPFTINSPGSYYVAADLTGAAGQVGIAIDASGVALDLSGFSLTGVPGSLDGVRISGTVQGVTICNGFVRSWGEDGIDCQAATAVSITGVTASLNTGRGIHLGQYGEAVRCRAMSNTGSGVATFSVARIADCQAFLNGGVGILGSASFRQMISGCIVENNSNSGIRAGASSVVSDCLATFNAEGIQLGNRATATRCTTTGNSSDGFILVGANTLTHCTAASNGADGIDAGLSCVIADNLCELNGTTDPAGAGIRSAGSRNRIESNHLISNDVGLFVTGIENRIARNTCQSNATNYIFGGRNHVDLEISQLPESINWPASVTIAGELVFGAGQNGIVIASDDVLLDFAGHTISGLGGSIDGVTVSGSRRNITIRDARVRDCGGDGIDLSNASGSRVEHAEVYNSAGFGVRVGNGCTVQDCNTLENDTGGISTGFSCVVAGCNARHLVGSGVGISAGDGSEVSGCSASGHATGIRALAGSSVVNCTARSNTVGFSIGTQCAASFCAASNNATGILIPAGATGARIDSNHAAGNGIGIDVAGTFNTITRNTMLSNATNLTFVAGNSIGPFGSVATTTNPWANLF